MLVLFWKQDQRQGYGSHSILLPALRIDVCLAIPVE